MNLGDGFTSNALEDQLQIYDRSVAEWMRSMPSRNAEKTVPVVMETPERAFSRMSEVLKDHSDESRERQRTLPLPMISVHRQDLSYDPNRFMSGTQNLTRLGYVDKNKSAVFQSEAPWPINIGYQIDFISRYIETANFWSIWVSRFFKNQLGYLLVDFSSYWYGWGKKLVPLRYETLADASNMAPGNQDRYIRKSLSCVLEGWVLGDFSVLKTVLEVQTDFRDATSIEDLTKPVTPEDAESLDQIELWRTDDGGTTVQ